MEHRVDRSEVKRWEEQCRETLDAAKWIARATWAANNCEEAPYRGTEASQWRAAAAKKEARAKKNARRAAARDDKEQEERDGEQDLRGHNPVKVLRLSGIRSGWRCTLCRKVSSKKKLLASRRCRGCPIVDWRRIDLDDGNGDEAQPTQLQQHRRMLSGTVLWCSRCGVYADKKAKGLKAICKGTPPRQRHRGGMEGQLRKLRNNTHPKTGAWLPPAIELDPIVLPRRVSADEAEQKPPDGFYRCEPVVQPAATPIVYAGGLSCKDRQVALRDRVRAKELASITRRDVISDVVSQSMAGDGLDIATADNNVITAGAHPCLPHDAGGGVWEYLFPHEYHHGVAAAQVWIMEKDESENSSSGIGPGEPHSWGAVCTDDSSGTGSPRHRFDLLSRR